VWQILIANVLIGVGIGFGYSAMPMLIMRSVPQSETGASNGLNALFRSLGTSGAAAVVGAVLATHTEVIGGVPTPTPLAFQYAFLLGGGAALVALLIGLVIPAKRDRHEQHPSLPE